ncbi:hypothetical protein [Bartonella senegalensis]|uniref:hypothetical protein n=1 Tax=Bartonella senegalensis TaxID=1468418 RepID=UPI0002EFCE34|nr:hypothetical protein [Bartonella senegalensis]
MIIFKILLGLGILGFIITAIIVFMVIVGLHYFFIKRARLYFKIGKELQKSVTQLSSSESGKKVKNLILDKQESLLSFKQSLILGAKDYKIIFFSSVVLAVFQTALSIVNMMRWSDEALFLDVLTDSLSICVVLLMPLIAVLSIILTGKVKKNIQSLEKAIRQRDEARTLQNAMEQKSLGQNARGGKHDQ